MRPCTGDEAAAEHPAVPVQRRGLAGRGRAQGAFGNEVEPAAGLGVGSRGRKCPRVADAHLTVEGRLRLRDEPAHIPDGDLIGKEPVSVCEHDLSRTGAYLRDVYSLSRGVAQAPALAEGEAVDAAVPCDGCAVIDDIPRPGRVPALLQPGGIVAVRDEAV